MSNTAADEFENDQEQIEWSFPAENNILKVLKNQVREQEHAVANVWEIQVGKLATQQIGDELQL